MHLAAHPDKLAATPIKALNTVLSAEHSLPLRLRVKAMSASGQESEVDRDTLSMKVTERNTCKGAICAEAKVFSQRHANGDPEHRVAEGQLPGHMWLKLRSTYPLLSQCCLY
jgi:hypothetical protein